MKRTRQIETCAARLDPEARRIYLELMDRARELIEQAASMRRSAWSLYHRRTGLVGRVPRKRVVDDGSALI